MTTSTPAIATAAAGVPGRHAVLGGAAVKARANRSVTFGRLIAVETRKLVDTRAARWLIISALGLSTAVLTLSLRFGPEAELGPMDTTSLLGMAAFALQLLLPVVAILAASGEWTHHVATVTYTVEPRRLRVLAAKTVAVVVAAVAAYLVMTAITFAAAGIASAGGVAITWTFNLTAYLWTGVTVIFYCLSGLALGTMLMNSPAAIVAFFLIPTLLTIAGSISDRFGQIVQWVDVSAAFAPLISASAETGPFNGAHMATTVAFWIAIPMVIGAVRVTRREVA